MIFKTKKTQVPVSNETHEVDAIVTWSVKWKSRYGEFMGEVTEECETFIDESVAKEFKTSLDNAYKLLKHTSGTRVTLTSNERK